MSATGVPRESRKSPARLVDVAEAAGVSRVTAAQVLNGSGGSNVRVSEQTREHVLKIARRLGYRPNRIAQQLKGVRSRLVGVIMDTVNLRVTSSRLAALEAAARARGFRLLVGQTHRDTTGIAEYLADFDARAVEGVVCLFDVMEGDERRLRPLFDRDRRVVFHGRPIWRGAPCVKVDTADAIGQLIRHLWERGRRRIGLQLWSREDELMGLRRAGYVDALGKLGLAVDERLIWYPSHGSAQPDAAALARLIDDLMVTRRVDAIIASNDIWAVFLLQALKARGTQVPSQIAITGFDNLDLSAITDPPLTTVDQNHEAYAEAVLDLLFGTKSGPGLKTKADMVRTIKAGLVVRAST